ncbi:hypothetical protein KC333_g2662 [Hortaea werneckii]|nr:hypothetical protein KC333_g2662 [Hortaea werneckii]KAI7306723.1 hypothetical protein KC326_g7780 [Hortaea werneckii]
MTAVPKIEIVNQLINDESGVYRVQHGDRVGYITISTDVFDEDTMCRPYFQIPQLPELPATAWTRMTISPSRSSKYDITVSNNLLPEIETLWHPRCVDILSLSFQVRHKSAVHEVPFENTTAIVKYAPFDWEIRRLKRETWAYGWLEEHRKRHPGWTMPVPKVLAHVTEEDRVIGLLLQRVEGEFAGPDDYDVCRKAILEVHGAGLVHGDVNRYNFLVDREQDRAILIDVEHAEEFDEVSAQRELESLAAELSETTGRGGPPIRV